MIRSHMKVMGLCLVAAFAMSAVAAATASATKPEFRFSGTKTQFSSKSGATTFTQKVSGTSEENGATFKCEKGVDTGEVEGASGTDKATNIVILLLDCSSTVVAKTFTCTTPGQEAGVIKTSVLEGQLGYISESAKTVGLVLKPKSPATLFAEFECTKGTEKIAVKVRGELIGKVTPVNELISPGGHFTQTYTANATKKWVQEPNELKVLGELKTGLLPESSISIIGTTKGEFLFSALTSTDEVFPLQSTEIAA
jgi:hypothetical protein